MHSTWASFINEKVSGANATVNEVEAGDQSITVEAAHLLAFVMLKTVSMNSMFSKLFPVLITLKNKLLK